MRKTFEKLMKALPAMQAVPLEPDSRLPQTDEL
jgi:hypothetical protein